VVCGNGCSHPKGTILAGHRRVAALRALGITEAAAMVHDDLSADEELDILLGDNLATSRARELSQLQRYRIEEAQREILARRAGQRTDLSGGAKGETAALIAKKTGQPANAVRNRQKVFGSAASPPDLQVAVDSGKVSLTAGAKMVRELEGVTAAERMWSERPASSGKPTIKRSLKSSSKKKAVAPEVVTPKLVVAVAKAQAPRPTSPAGARERIRSVAMEFDVLHQRLLGVVEEVLSSFPPMPSAGVGAANSRDIWAARALERWLPFVAATNALVAHRVLVDDLIAHAIGAVEAFENETAQTFRTLPAIEVG
jgi:ParB-like chromosome segregation protein Spo0J